MWCGAGTSNDEAIPNDPSGSRRYVAVQCGTEADWDYVPANRDQLWSEALALYNDWLAEGSPNPPPNLLPPELREAQEAVNALHTGSDASMEALVDALEPLWAKYTGWVGAVKMLDLWEAAHTERARTTGPGTAPNIPPFGKPEQTRFGAALGPNRLAERPPQRTPTLVQVAPQDLHTLYTLHTFLTLTRQKQRREKEAWWFRKGVQGVQGVQVHKTAAGGRQRWPDSSTGFTSRRWTTGAPRSMAAGIAHWRQRTWR